MTKHGLYNALPSSLLDDCCPLLCLFLRHLAVHPYTFISICSSSSLFLYLNAEYLRFPTTRRYELKTSRRLKENTLVMARLRKKLLLLDPAPPSRKKNNTAVAASCYYLCSSRNTKSQLKVDLWRRYCLSPKTVQESAPCAKSILLFAPSVELYSTDTRTIL